MEISEELERVLGNPVFTDDDVIDVASIKDMELVFVNGKVLGIIVEGQPFLSVRGLLAYGSKKRHVTVDMGAVKFVYNGADVMAPGVVDADMSIAEDDIVWIRDERNYRPLAVGLSLVSGSEMVESRSGKAVQSLHHVGDAIWKLDED